MGDTIGSCLRNHKIHAIHQQILKPIMALYNLEMGARLTEQKSLDAIKYVPTEPWNLVDTIVVYGTIEFVLFFSKF